MEYITKEERAKTKIRDIFGPPKGGFLTNDEFIARAKWRHNNFYNYDKTNYINNKTKVTVTCPIHGDFEIVPFNHLVHGGTGCKKCGSDKGVAITVNRIWTFDEYVKLANEKHNNRYKYLRFETQEEATGTTSKTGRDRYIVYECPLHGIIKTRTYNHLKDGDGCRICGNITAGKTRTMLQEEYIKQAKLAHNGRYDYSKVVYVDGRRKITIICPKHGEFQQQAAWHLRSNGQCPKCSISKGELRIIDILNKYKIQYDMQYKIFGYRYKYDFYLPAFNLLIEFDGAQHFKSNFKMNLIKRILADNQPVKVKNKISLVAIMLRDRIKDTLAQLYGYKIIRVPYTLYDQLEYVLIGQINLLFKYKYNNKYYRNPEELVLNHPILTKQGCKQYYHQFDLQAPTSGNRCSDLTKLLETPKALTPEN